jgi:hypothetical protein
MMEKLAKEEEKEKQADGNILGPMGPLMITYGGQAPPPPQGYMPGQPQPQQPIYGQQGSYAGMNGYPPF